MYEGSVMTVMGAGDHSWKPCAVKIMIMSAQAIKPSKLTIRAATPADMNAVIRLVNAAFSIETFIDGTRTDHKHMAEMMQKGQFFVGLEDGGCIVASVYTELRGDRAYLGMLAVDPSRQGAGLGKQMTESVEDYCRQHGCKHLDITVLSLRPELLPLYKKMGFVETSTEEFRPPRPLKPGFECQGIKMSKPL